jgi:hypothetical protein
MRNLDVTKGMLKIKIDEGLSLMEGKIGYVFWLD